MKKILLITRILLGIVFIFSGFVKGIDPMGSAIKFSDYFEVFHMDWMIQASLFLSILQSVAEFLIGIALLLGFRMIITAWSALIFMMFFTILTLYIAIANPVTDCGCFGDAIKLTNWGTFYKNIVLIAFAVLVFVYRKKYIAYAKPLVEWLILGGFILVFTALSIYCLEYLPIMDFRPYHIGTHIPSKMVIPEGEPAPEYATTLYYSKNGVVKEFTLSNFPSNDTTWKFVDSKSVLVKEGYKPSIYNFSIIQQDGSDITEKVLSDSGYSFLFISPDIEKITPKDWTKINELYNFIEKQGYRFYFLNGSPQNIIDQVKAKYQIPFEFCFTDVTTLKTIIRANPGLVLLKEGVVLANWSAKSFPKPDDLKGNLLSNMITGFTKSNEHKRVYLLLSFMVVAIILIIVNKRRQ